MLQYASSELKNNKWAVIITVTEGAYALCFASDKLKSNKWVVTIVVLTQGGYLL